jgi:hypothetical protein
MGLGCYARLVDSVGPKCARRLGRMAKVDNVSPAKTTSERVAKLRADRDALGLKRLELYAHPEDWTAIKALAERLQRKRAKKLAPPRAG